MKTHWQAVVVALLPAVLAWGQPPGGPNNVGGLAPGQFGGPQPGQFRGPGPQGIPGPPPNAMFSAIDSDGDGVITKTELRKAVVQLRKLDTDRDGNITLAEVSQFGPPGGPARDPAQFAARVMENDKNNDGQLTLDEVPDNIKPMIRDADSDKNNIVTRDELMAAVQNMQNRFPGGPGPWNNSVGNFRGQPGPGNRAGTNQMTGRLMKQNDKDGDKMLSASELPASMRGEFRPEDDLNKDGALDAAELQAVVQRMGDRAKLLRGGAEAERNGERGRGENNRTRNRARDAN